MILNDIIDYKRLQVADPEYRKNIFNYINSLDHRQRKKSLSLALKEPGKVSLLAEIKRASPSGGMIREDCSPSDVAAIYERNGAAAISVLTDEKFFKGNPRFIPEVRKVSELPLLRKDFIIDPLQIYEAAMLGADAVLLITSVLTGHELENFMQLARELGLECLVEVHHLEELKQAVDAGARMIGINNRDLKTFKTDLGTTLKLMEHMGNPRPVTVSESGIKRREDIELLKGAGVDAVLVGEALMREPDIAAKVLELAGV